jgi:hypothetical protein
MPHCRNCGHRGEDHNWSYPHCVPCSKALQRLVNRCQHTSARRLYGLVVNDIRADVLKIVRKFIDAYCSDFIWESARKLLHYRVSMQGLNRRPTWTPVDGVVNV